MALQIKNKLSINDGETSEKKTPKLKLEVEETDDSDDDNVATHKGKRKQIPKKRKNKSTRKWSESGKKLQKKEIEKMENFNGSASDSDLNGNDKKSLKEEIKPDRSSSSPLLATPPNQTRISDKENLKIGTDVDEFQSFEKEIQKNSLRTKDTQESDSSTKTTIGGERKKSKTNKKSVDDSQSDESEKSDSSDCDEEDQIAFDELLDQLKNLKCNVYLLVFFYSSYGITKKLLFNLKNLWKTGKINEEELKWLMKKCGESNGDEDDEVGREVINKMSTFRRTFNPKNVEREVSTSGKTVTYIHHHYCG